MAPLLAILISVVLVSLFVNIAATIFSAAIQEKLDQWRKTKRWMLFITAGCIVLFAALLVVTAQFLSATTFKFAPRSIQIPAPPIVSIYSLDRKQLIIFAMFGGAMAFSCALLMSIFTMLISGAYKTSQEDERTLLFKETLRLVVFGIIALASRHALLIFSVASMRDAPLRKTIVLVSAGFIFISLSFMGRFLFWLEDTKYLSTRAILFSGTIGLAILTLLIIF